MPVDSRSLKVVALGLTLALAACGGSGSSPAAPTAAITSVLGSVPSDDGAFTASGNGYGPGPGTGGGVCGDACTGPVGPDPADILTLLGDALQEEYRAEMLYRSVLEDYPGARPFAAIVESEAVHVEALQMLFTRRQQAPPASIWTPGSFEPFDSIQAACAGGVRAETEDATFYTPYLQRTDLPPDVRNVFTNLQAASLERHLPAFARCR